jgi:hypothetical protein
VPETARTPAAERLTLEEVASEPNGQIGFILRAHPRDDLG